MKPSVSVLICTYNSAGTLPAALRSLEAQTLARERFEVLVVDDGSGDATEEAVGTSRVRYLRNTSNLGLPASCNRGLEEATGEYFIRLDADDRFEPGILAAMLPWLEAGVTDFVSCDRYEIETMTGARREVRIEGFDIYKLIAIGVMMRRDLLREIGGYQSLFWEEYDLFIRYLLKSGKAPHHLNKPLLTQTLHPGSMTANPERVWAGWKEFMSRWSIEEAERFGRLPCAVRGARA